jgi:hypothetical protein
MASEQSTGGTEQPFEEWLTEKAEEYREAYHDGPRSETPRQTDVALGRLRAFRDARAEFLDRKRDADTNCNCDHAWIRRYYRHDFCPDCGTDLRSIDTRSDGSTEARGDE